MKKLLLLFSMAVAAMPATMLEQRIDEILRTSRVLTTGAVGVEVVQLRSGKVLYSRDADRLFTPASNTKLFSTALALHRLGRDHRMTTRIYAAAAPDTAGTVNGALTLYGGGDPSMSDIAIPYRRDGKADPMDAMDELAAKIAGAGVKSINGDIVGDDTAWPWEPYPPGWSADDSIWDYGAPVSALQFNHGMFHLSIQPGRGEGDAAMIALAPPLEYFTISNRARTTKEGEQKIEIDRPLGSREIRLWGTVRGGTVEDMAVDDAALYAATAFHDALIRCGISVRGVPVARHREQGEGPQAAPAGVVVAERQSPPLVELLKVTDKVSQNLWAEMLLREVAKVKTGDGARTAGLEELKAFLTEMGADKASYVFEDGSGLSRLTLVAPSVVTRLLRFMYLSRNGAEWKTLLPVGAQDGSLTNRFSKNAAANAIFAKTGSLSHVNALSGYTESATYGELTFSIIVNHTSGRASEVRAAIDKIALALLE